MSKPLPKKWVAMGKFGPCATEHNPQRFIGAEPVEVDLSTYYVRRLADGDLIEAPAKKPAKKGDE